MSFIKPPCVEGSGSAVAEQRNVDSFNSIVLDVEASVTVAQGSTQDLEVTAQENLQQIITTEVSNGTLTIAETQCFSTSTPVEVGATIPTINGITVTSSGKVAGSGLSLQNSFVSVSASGGITLNDITASSINVRVTSSGNVELTGTSNALDVNLSSSGDITADGCTVENCTVNVSGSGDVRVNVTGNLNVTISASGNVYYKGNPTIEQHITGSGKLIPLD